MRLWQKQLTDLSQDYLISSQGYYVLYTTVYAMGKAEIMENGFPIAIRVIWPSEYSEFRDDNFSSNENLEHGIWSLLCDL